MTTDEAIKWLKHRSVMVIFHRDQIILVAPRNKFVVDVRDKFFKIDAGKDFTVAMSDRGDSLVDVVQAARASWRTVVGPVDALSDIHGLKAPPAELQFVGDVDRLFGGIIG